MKNFNSQWLYELTEHYEQLQERKHLNNYLLEHFPKLSVFQYDEIQNNLENIGFDLYQTKKQLMEILIDEEFNINNKLKVIQIGTEKSIAIQENLIDDNDPNIYLISNKTLNLMSEIGAVEWNM